MDANPGLVDLGPVLPLGTVVVAPATRAIIQLWD